MAEPIFRFNTQMAAQFRRLTQARFDQAVDRAWVAVQRWAQEWSRRTARVTPREDGSLAAQWFVVPIRDGNRLTIILANHLKYGEFLEFGTRFIAGGHVLGWKYGDPPVMTWKAKAAMLQRPSARASAKSHEKWSKRTAAAMTHGIGEQMPMAREVGFRLLPDIMEEVRRIIVAELSD